MAVYRRVKKTLLIYWSLTKPRVMMANALTAAAGFLMAAAHFDRFGAWRFIALMAGSTLVIAAACALNNYLDRDIDAKMERTKKRVTVTGAVGRTGAVIFSAVLLAAGLVLLVTGTNWLVTAIGAFGFIDYVWLYGAWSKRRSMHGTLVGSVSGAIPVLAGYCAVSGKIDTGAILVFASLFFWQMPEFYSIAIYRRKEYAVAGVPVISVVKGIKITKLQIFAYTAMFAASTMLLSAFGYTGWVYLAVMGILSLYWLAIGWQGLKTAQNDRWARRMFRFSMIIILALCVMLPLGAILP